jgi:hypothetical protein
MSKMQMSTTMALALLAPGCGPQVPTLQFGFDCDKRDITPKIEQWNIDEYLPFTAGERHPDGSIYLENGDRRYPNSDRLLGDSAGTNYDGKLWTVPPEYYDEWRPWYGRVYQRATWTCYRRGQLLVIGPPMKTVKRRSVDRNTGTPCLFIKPVQQRRYQFGEYCAVFCNRGFEILIACERLVPIEVCDVDC